MPKLDAARLLQDNNLQLVDVGSKPGELRVRNIDGLEQTLDLNKLMADQGIKGAEVIVNTPDAPIQRSPVGFSDRVKMSLGNAKGQIGYLKKSFEDARLNEDGQMLVKDKGAWFTVDPTGLGDGNGWDIAAELAKDVVGDMVGDAALITGQIGGSAAAATLALPTGPGAIAAGVAGASAGTMAAKGVTTALGRIVGTYEATPEEQMKDVALDGLLALGGEGVALGAKHLVVPALKKAVTSIGKNASAPVKSILAETISQTTGAKSVNAARLLNHPEAVTGQIDTLLKEAAAAGADMTDDALLAASKRRSMAAAAPILQDAQKALSGEWRRMTGEAIALADDALEMDIISPISGALKEVGDMGLLKLAPDGSHYIPAPPKVIAQKLSAAGVDELTAQQIGKRLAAWTNAAGEVLDANGILKGKEGVAQLLKVGKAFDDFYYNLVDGRPQLQQILTPTSSKLRNGLLSALPGDVGKAVAGVKSFYSAHKPMVEMAERAMRSGPQGLEGIVNHLYSAAPDQVAIRDGVRAIAKLKGKTGQAAMDALENVVAAHDFVKIAPRGAVGSSAPRMAAAGAVGLTLGPMAGIAAAGAVSPRGTARSVALSAKTMAAFNKMVRGMSEKNRNSFLQNPELVGAALTEVMRSMGGRQ